MKTYEITGWAAENCVRGAESLLSLIDRLSTGAERLCLEAHFSDFGSLQAVADQVSSARFALYGWTRIDGGSFWQRREFGSLKSARCIFRERALDVSEDRRDMIPYDWNGLAGVRSVVSYSERYVEPIEKGKEEPNQQLLHALSEIAAENFGQPLEIKTSTTRAGDYRKHSYMVFCANSQVAQLLGAICERLKLREGVGSFEFVGTAEILGKILESGLYRLEEFPPDCWSFNDGDGKVSFALERASFLNPVLNLNAADLSKVATLIDSLGSKIVRCSVIRKYLSWKLANGASPHTQDNYALISKQKKGGYALFVGFEQYADGDPSPKEFLAFTAKFWEQQSLKIKSVPYSR